MPSRFEGFGLSALEAMLAGRVVLVSDVAGIAPHVRKSGGGMAITPSVDTVKQALRELLAKRSQWKAMGMSGRQYVMDHLRWDQIGAKTLKHYREIFLPSSGTTPTPTTLAATL